MFLKKGKTEWYDLSFISLAQAFLKMKDGPDIWRAHYPKPTVMNVFSNYGSA